MRRRALALAAGLVVLAACDGGRSPDPVPSPSPTRTPTGSPVTSDDTSSCPPITGFETQLVTIPLRATTPLPDGGTVRVAQVTPRSGTIEASVVLEVVRKTTGCPTDAFELDLPEGGGVTARGVKVDVVAVTAVGGMPPTVQLRIGPA